MLNPIVSCTVYAVEMLIVYLFFTRITERRRPVMICFILGLVYFEFGSVINLLFHNSTWINTVTCAFIISIFAITCFHIRPHMAVIYSVILNLLNYILEIVGMQDISFDYDVKTCNLNSMEDMDLVAVLGNLMDNALTSAGESAQKKISLSTTARDGFSVMIISNSCDSSPKLQGTHLISSKKEKSLHGYGLKSVSRTLKKYDGGFDWDYDEVTHMFTTTVMIKDLHE